MVSPIDDLVAEKNRIRAASLAARSRRDPAELSEAGAAVAGHGVDQWRNASMVAAYLSVGTEPATRPLLDTLASVGVRILVPIVAGTGLDWADYSAGGEVAVGALGVAEPTGPRLGPGALSEVEVILVPALAVDRSGTRLGRGRGYYDRALAGVRTPTVAVVYDDELLDWVPAEPHDRPVDGALCPAGYVPL